MSKKSVKVPVNKLPVTISAPAGIETANKISPENNERERRYKAEDALRDIERAETHKLNKDLMKDVKKVAKEKIKALGKIT